MISWLGSTPVAHVSGSLVLLATIVHGAQEVMISRFDAEGVLDWLRGRLAPFKLPTQIVVTEAIPRNALGKVDRVAVTRIVESA
ncbi:MAG: 2-succinylbenzoate--CoA ligase [Pseudomonas fluorescens]|nr:MAG: 2-succinylbenzoate--CoA ligase [Pseudomonas fluorescens]